mgnify:CR=1 FL=1
MPRHRIKGTPERRLQEELGSACYNGKKALVEAALEAERLGFESVWLPEHLVFPTDMDGSPFPGADHPPVPPTTPVFDVFTYLGFLAGQPSRLRLGTHVYLLGLRHPFVAARAVQTPVSYTHLPLPTILVV